MDWCFFSADNVPATMLDEFRTIGQPYVLGGAGGYRTGDVAFQASPALTQGKFEVRARLLGGRGSGHTSGAGAFSTYLTYVAVTASCYFHSYEAWTEQEPITHCHLHCRTVPAGIRANDDPEKERGWTLNDRRCRESIQRAILRMLGFLSRWRFMAFEMLTLV